MKESSTSAAAAAGDTEDALYTILKGTAVATGESFFTALVKNLCRALGTYAAWVTELDPARRQLRSFAFWVGGALSPGFVLDLEGTPCEIVVTSRKLLHYPDNVLEVFPDNPTLRRFQAVSYMGIPLLTPDRRVIGNLAVLDVRPMPLDPKVEAIFQIFAARASAEVQRILAEREIVRSEEKFRRIVETAAEGFLLMDHDFVITDVNAAFCRMVGYPREKIVGRQPVDFVDDESRHYLEAQAEGLFSRPFNDFEIVVLSRSGERIPLLAHGGILYDNHGANLGQMVFVTDMRAQKRSLVLAAEVQKNFLPSKRPRIPGFAVDWRRVNCDEIGGDYLDFFDNGECWRDRFGVVVGDVMGHGVEAALLMSSARSLLRTNVAACQEMAATVTRTNRHLTHDVRATHSFMTLLYLTIDTATRELRWVRAGHDPALLFDPASESFEPLKGRGVALGLDGDYTYREYARRGFPAGGIVVMGTDGLWESRGLSGEMYGKTRLREVIRRHARLGTAEIIDAVFADLNRFRRGARQEDDMTLLVVKEGRAPQSLH